MKTLGLTGGVGMGKSLAADLLQQRGLPVIDTDQLARRIVEPGQPALSEIQRCFGADILDADGGLRREELASRVFQEDSRRRLLEGILHPRIRELWKQQLREWESGGQAWGVVVIPLLFETQAEGELDGVLCIGCSASTQRARLQTRGWGEEQINQRNQAQWPLEQKLARADYVIWNEGNVEVLREQIDRILARIGFTAVP